MTLVALAITLFIVFDPFGNIPVFQTALSRCAPERRQAVLIRELLIALAILAFFTLAGNHFLSVLGLKTSALNISGGIILFLIALGMVFPNKSVMTDNDDEEPFIVPLAIPLFAGPSAISILILNSTKIGIPTTLTALAIAWIPATLVLLGSTKIYKILGRKGSRALERLMGLILIMIATQMILDGVHDWIRS